MSNADKESASTDTVGFDPARWLWLLDKASPQLMAQLALHGQLLHLEWQQEKCRLQWMMLLSVLSISFVFLTLLFAGFALLYLTRNHASFSFLIWALPLVFFVVAVTSLFLIRHLTKKSQSAFSSSKTELATDLTLLRHQL